ncbi:MAG: efflux transporter periplasmic adaptor subunit, partial [Proteobacteria bacterium]|nr:efflux transporter periplasmic adaptor subunit [Pseudomonadota bacterium]
DRRLRPGMFASIFVVTGTGSDVVTVPRTAVTFYPYGDSIFVINGDGDDMTVERRQIKTGRVRAGQIEILSGLQAGEWVVSAGQLKLRTGQKIRIDNSVVLPEDVTGP